MYGGTEVRTVLHGTYEVCATEDGQQTPTATWYFSDAGERPLAIRQASLRRLRPRRTGVVRQPNRTELLRRTRDEMGAWRFPLVLGYAGHGAAVSDP